MNLPATTIEAQPAAETFRSARPIRWLGAPATGGLALPAANPTASHLYAPRGVWTDGQRLIVCDSGNHRLLLWQQLPVADHAPADVVLGQADFTSEGPAAAGRGPENGLHLPTGVIVIDRPDGPWLVVADAWHHRLLLWQGLPTASDTPPDAVIGQPTLSEVQSNRGGTPSAASLYWPYGLAWIDGRLVVADTGNRRVLFWNGLPGADLSAAAPAAVVLGQDDASGHDENRGGPISASSFRWPHAIAGSDDLLLIADAGNHRLLGWRGRIECDRPADLVLGQQNFESAWELPHQPQGPQRLRFPYGVAVADDLLLVADTANNRLLGWQLPLAGQQPVPAEFVLGQTDFAGSGENRWQAVLPDTFCWPYGLAAVAGQASGQSVLAAVADSGNNRVMLWKLAIEPAAPSAAALPED